MAVRQSELLPYLVLLQVGFTMPRSVATRAVRSYRTISPLPRKRGGIFSVALSVGSRPPGVTWHPARRSPDFPPDARIERLPGRLRGEIYQHPGSDPNFFNKVRKLYMGCLKSGPEPINSYHHFRRVIQAPACKPHSS
jgi:hypothetical protein